jgi:hypothetical protein
MMETTLPTARAPSGKVHAVWAGERHVASNASPLTGYYTLCGWCIPYGDRWRETEDKDVTCGSCCAVLTRRGRGDGGHEH